MIVSCEGEESAGKTTLAYTSPRPVVGFAFDMGFERAIYGAKYDELFKGDTIEVVPFDRSKEQPDPITADVTIFELPAPVMLGGTKVQGMARLWSYFIIRIAAAMTDKRVRSIVVDTMTSARRVRADAHLEDLQGKPLKQGEHERVQLIQIEWGKPNDDIKNLYTTCQGVRKNLVAIHHLTDERTDGVGSDGRIVQGMLTGKRVLEGLAPTYRFVDLALRMEKQNGGLRAEFKKCGYNLALEGTTMENPTWDTIVEQIELFTGDRMKLEKRIK